MWMKRAYLYLVCVISLSLLMVAGIQLMNRLLNSAFKLGTYYGLQDISWAMSTIIVSFPVWLYHWKTAQAEDKASQTSSIN